MRDTFLVFKRYHQVQIVWLNGMQGGISHSGNGALYHENHALKHIKGSTIMK